MWYCRNFFFFLFWSNICHIFIENVWISGDFFIDYTWTILTATESNHMYVCTRGNIHMGILRFLRSLDFLQTTCSDAFTRSILRIGFLERNSVGSVRKIYSQRRHTRTITKYRDYESFMDGNAPVSTKLKRERSAVAKIKKKKNNKKTKEGVEENTQSNERRMASFHSCANNWSLEHRWMFIGIAGKGKINTVANPERACISGIDFSHRIEERYNRVCIVYLLRNSLPFQKLQLVYVE